MPPPQRSGFVPLKRLPLAALTIGAPVCCLSLSLLITHLITRGTGLNNIAGSDAAIEIAVASTTAVFEILLLAVTVGIAQRREMRWPPAALAWKDWIKDRSFLPFLVFILLWQLIEQRLIEPSFPKMAVLERLPAATPALLLSLVSMVVLAPVAEEIFFRGFVFAHLRAYAGFGTTIVVTAVAFALLHFSDGFALPVVTLPFGLMAGIARERYASVRPAIYLHMIWNLIAWGEGYFGGS